MIDSILAWFVVIAPTLFALGIEVISEEIRKSGRWRVGVLCFGLLLSGLTWWQQSRERKTSAREREEAIQETAMETSKRVTSAVTEQFKQTIADQVSQITDLKRQLEVQGKDVSIIKGSNFVTGKNPVKVEVTNPANHDSSSPKINLFDEGSTVHNPTAGKHERTLLAITDKPITPVRLIVMCEGGLNTVGAGILGSKTLMGGGGMKTSQNTFRFSIEAPAWTPTSPLVLNVYYDEENLGMCSARLE